MAFSDIIAALSKELGTQIETDGDVCAIQAEILKQIEDWEEQLAECSTSGNPTDLTEINDDLRDFILNNRGTIQPFLDKALADNA